jgi:hypothetical protein
LWSCTKQLSTIGSVEANLGSDKIQDDWEMQTVVMQWLITQDIF